MMLSIDLLADREGPMPVSAKRFGQRLRPTFERLFNRDATIEILLTNDERMRQLNRVYRGADATTDVLSLPTAIDSERGPVVPQCSTPGVEHNYPIHLGTIVISLDQANRQIGHGVYPAKHIGRSGGNTLEDELMGLAEHGLRHLLGHDHDEQGNWQTTPNNERS